MHVDREKFSILRYSLYVKIFKFDQYFMRFVYITIMNIPFIKANNQIEADEKFVYVLCHQISNENGYFGIVPELAHQCIAVLTSTPC